MTTLQPTSAVEFEFNCDGDYYADAVAETLAGKLTVTASRDEPDTSSDSRRAKCSLTFTLEAADGSKLSRDAKAEFYGDLEECLEDHMEDMFETQESVIDFGKKLQRSAKAAVKAGAGKKAPKPN